VIITPLGDRVCVQIFNLTLLFCYLVMSGKNKKKLRRLGLDRKSKNQYTPVGQSLILLTRDQLFQVMDLLHLSGFVRRMKVGRS